MARFERNSNKQAELNALASMRPAPEPFFIADDGDICRRCRGDGIERFSDGSAFTCDLCGGSGNRSVRVS